MTTATATPAIMVRSADLAPLTVDQLRAAVPAIFQTRAHSDASARYGFASTLQVLQALESEGWIPVEARAYMRRDADRAPFTKHMLRLRRAGDLRSVLVGDVVPQTVLVNSHDRTARLELYAAAWRKACDNGLMVSTSDVVEPLRVRHTQNMVEEVMSNIRRIAADAGRVSDLITRMQRVHLTDKQQYAFARQAATLRDGAGTVRGSVDPRALLVPRRKTDEGDALWHVYNRVQENMTKGGIASVTAAGRHTTTKPVLAINADLKINGGLWSLAMDVCNKAKGR
jgi:hypothetical protein